MRPANRHGAADFDLDKNGDGYPMPQIDVTERRITTALDRIRKSIEREPVPQMANAVAHELESKVSQLQSNLQEANAELSEEQSTNAQLEQRVRRLRERIHGVAVARVRLLEGVAAAPLADEAAFATELHL